MTDRRIPVSLIGVQNPTCQPRSAVIITAKYVVIDRRCNPCNQRELQIQWIPPAGMMVTGVGAYILKIPHLAEYFRAVYMTDSQGKSVIFYNGSPGNLETGSLVKHTSEFPPGFFYLGATVRPVISPDTSGSDYQPYKLSRTEHRDRTGVYHQ